MGRSPPVWAVGLRFGRSGANGAPFDQSVRALYDQSVRALFDPSVRALFDQSVRALFDQSVRALFDQSVRALFDHSVRALFDQSVRALFDQSVRRALTDHLAVAPMPARTRFYRGPDDPGKTGGRTTPAPVVRGPDDLRWSNATLTGGVQKARFDGRRSNIF